MEKYKSAILTLFAALNLSMVGHAVPVLSTANLVGNSSGQNASIGWEFTTNSPIVVTSLGFFDSGQDGLVDNHDVGIFDGSSGTLLVSATVSAGNSAPLINQFRYVSITPLALAAGLTFRIAALLPSSADTFLNNLASTAHPAINGVGGRFRFGTPALADPTNPLVTPNPFLGPNFEIQDSSPTGVPELNSQCGWPTMMVLLLLGTVASRRKSSPVRACSRPH